MKHTIVYSAWLVVMLLVNACYDDGDLKEGIEDLNVKYSSLESRIAALESQVKQINSNISSIQGTISALERNVYVSRVEELTNGYKIYFTDNTVATIYDGKDGADGSDGKDGENGKDGTNAPVIGVAQVDGVYYWTITTNGHTTWLLGANGEKLRVTGENGKDGQDGTDGKNGEDGSPGEDGVDGSDGKDGVDGKDGANGVTPLIKIDPEGYWIVSYDNGLTYKRVLDANNFPVSALGKDGTDGKDGQDGTDGQDGADGKNGHSPVIAVKQAADGLYYWTKDGDWITDGQGHKIRANGIDGNNGQDALSPLLKIENGRWMLSTNNGVSWTDIGQATGDSGKDGVDGKDGHSPEIAVKQAADGLYYWTKDGDWITDGQGHKIRANGIDGTNGQDALSPLLKIENGRWMLSTNNGVSWTDIGQATGESGKDGVDGKDGTSFFQEVTQDDHRLTLVLANGTSIQIPKYKPLTITFSNTEEVVVMPGSSQTIYYTLSGAGANTTVKALGQNGWGAKVTSISSTSGSITISAPDPMTNDEIVVLVHDGENTTIMSYITCVQGVVNVADNLFNISATGGTQAVQVTTNINYSINIPSEARTWLSVQQSKATREETVTFIVAQNTGGARSATVELRDNSGKAVQTLLFKQATYALNLNVTTAGTLKSLMTEEDLKHVRELKITGTLNATDFETLTASISSLTKLDLSGVNLSELPLRAFGEATNVKSVILPDNLTVINEQDFQNCTSLESIIIPAGVTAIKVQAFSGCTALTSVNIPANVTEIRAGAFKGCTSLQTVNIPTNSNLKIIDGLTNEGAFQGCTALSGITIPANLKTVGSYAFSGCSRLENIYFTPNSSCDSIGNYAFNNCSKLVDIKYFSTSKVKTIGGYAFYNCSSLTNVSFPETVETIGTYGFYGCASLSSIEIPVKVKRIERYTFNRCSGLKILVIPVASGLSDIDLYAFEYCNKLSLIEIGITTPPSLDYRVFSVYSTCVVKVPKGSLATYQNHTYWNDFAKITEE